MVSYSATIPIKTILVKKAYESSIDGKAGNAGLRVSSVMRFVACPAGLDLLPQFSHRLAKNVILYPSFSVDRQLPSIGAGSFRRACRTANLGALRLFRYCGPTAFFPGCVRSM
jgi:hypothetical protein